MLSPQVSVTSPSGANTPATSTRRRGLSYLRGLSQNRTAIASTADTPRISPRSYFARSTSYNEVRAITPEPPRPDPTRRRSASRPNEITSRAEPLNITNANDSDRDLFPSAQTRRAQSVTRKAETAQVEVPAEDSSAPDIMARHRTASSKRVLPTNEPQNARTNGDGSAEAVQSLPSNREVSKTSTIANGDDQPENKPKLPILRLFPHQEPRSARQSLNFLPVTRTLPNDSAILRVGRYSEREGIPITNPTTPSDAPIGFKSKVVSRKHCEFSFVNSQWHVKDVSSSSGTFLNHVRLSQPNTDSRLFPVKDGDILQLGIDFRGGEEMIFRCVKIRIECDRSWQKRPNNFNKTRHAQLKNLSSTVDQPTGGEMSNSGECAICLGSMLPYQALFVAPCAHAWHYKCIRPMLEGKNSTYPQFQCPNCRAYADLSADVDVSVEDMDEDMGDAGEQTDDDGNEDQAVVTVGDENVTNNANGPAEAEDAPLEHELPTSNGTVPRKNSLSGSGLLARRHAANGSTADAGSIHGLNMPDPFDPDEMQNDLGPEITRIESPDPAQITGGEGPLTPRNNAGPFVFDGSAGRSAVRRLIASSIPESSER